MSQEQKKELLEQYSQESNLNSMSDLSEAQKSELLFALGWKKMLEKKSNINRTPKIMKHLCQTKLQTLLLLEKHVTPPIEKIDTTDYKKQYSIHKDQYTNILSVWQQSWDILVSPHIFDHVISNWVKYKSWSLEEKMKHARWLSPNFSAKDRKQQNSINKKYTSLDPEKVDISVIDFLKTGEVQKKKYTPNEEVLLKQRLLDNHNYCKDVLFWYTPLVLPKEGWYSQKTTDRIVKLHQGEQSPWYLVSENMPIRYIQDHLKKYRWNEISFEIFANKESLVAYLQNELFFITKQRERFQETITYFTALDAKAENKENLLYAYIGFSTHGSFTDQYITQKLEQLISGDKRGNKQIIDAIIHQVKEGIKENEAKEKSMREHYNAITANNSF